MNSFAQRLASELDSVPVVDPHCHLRPAKPEADGLADLVLYHHVWVELVSAGMPATAATRAGLPHELTDPGMEPVERLRAALPYLPRIANTTCGGLLRTLLEDLYDVPGGVLTDRNLEDMLAVVGRRSGDPAWREELLGGRCRIVKALTVEGGDQPACCERIGRATEAVPINLVSGKAGPRDTLAAIERRLGRELASGEDYAEALRALGQDYARRDLHFIGLWVLPYLSYQRPTGAQVSSVIERARADGPVSHEELSAFTCLGVRSFLEGWRDAPVRTVQVIVGAEVLPPHRSLTHWSPEVVGALGRLAGEFEDVHFSCSSASDLYTQDLAILAKHVPNVSVAGYWWHTLYPHYIRKSLETRLEIVPANKIVAFFSDAYHAEWCYPKLRLVKRVLGEVLAEKVAAGDYTEDVALGLVRQVFHDTPARIYGVRV